MKKLSEYKNEEALDLLADIIEPLSEIMADKDVAEKLRNKSTIAAAVSVAIKKHKKAIMQLMARLEGVDEKEYTCGVFTLPAKLLELMNDKDMLGFFTLQGQKMANRSFGSATENTEETETE